MEKFKNLDEIDFVKMKEVTCLDNDKATCFFAPGGCWNRKSIEQLKGEKVVLDGIFAVMKRGTSFILGYEDDGVISFPKNPEGISPEYHNQFNYNHMPSLMKVCEKAWAIDSWALD